MNRNILRNILILSVIVLSIFLVGCASSGQSGYAAYNQPQQGQYVGGGCGVAPSGDYENAPTGDLDSADSAL